MQERCIEIETMVHYTVVRKTWTSHRLNQFTVVTHLEAESPNRTQTCLANKIIFFQKKNLAGGSKTSPRDYTS